MPLRTHPAEIGEELMRMTTAFDSLITGVAERNLVIGRETLLIDHNMPGL
jgi:hypothetical protein